MDPIVQLLQNLLTTQGASMGMNPTMISTIGSGIDMYQNFMNQENQSKGSRLNTDRLRDIEAYRVNPFKGFMAQRGGFAQPQQVTPVKQDRGSRNNNPGNIRPRLSDIEAYYLTGQLPKGVIGFDTSYKKAPKGTPGDTIYENGEYKYVGEGKGNGYKSSHYLQFKDIELGRQAQRADLDAKLSGKSSAMKKSDYMISKYGADKVNNYKDFFTLEDYLNVYAPSTDANNPASYAKNVASFLKTQQGVDIKPDTLMKDLPPQVIDGLVQAMIKIESPDSYNRLYNKMQMGGMAQGISPELLPLTMVPFISPGLNLLPQTVQSLQTGGLITTSRLAPLMQGGGFVNTTGYTPGTPSFNNPVNIIPGNNITMKNTPFPLMAIPNIGNPKLLTPGQQNVNFPGANYVTELPLMMFGGNPLAALYQMGYGGMIESYDRGGRIAKRQARLEKRQDRLEAKGKTGGQRYENIQARLDDIAAGGSGISKTGRFFEDVGNVAAKVAKAAAPIMSFIPGVGLAVGPAMAAAGSLLDQAIVTDKERGVGLSGGQQPATQNYTNPQANYAPSQAFNPMSLFSMINPGINAGQYPFASLTTPAVPTGGMNPNVGTYNPAQNSGIYNPLQAPKLTPQTVQQLTSGLGQLQPMYGNTLPKLQLPDLNLHKKKGGTVKGKKKMILFNSPAMYQMGGEVQGINLIPIQTEKVGKIAEMIIHTDNTITPVNATKPHSRMEPDEVTDIVPEGSYIASADKSIKITYDEADEILIAVKADSYEELKKGKLPQEIKLSSLWPEGNKKPLTPAELTKLVLQKYPTVDRDDLFTKMTNQSNIDSRLPYLMQIIKLNEEKKNSVGAAIAMEAPMFKKGGKVTSKYTKSYQSGGPAPGGGFGLDSLLSLLGTAAPLIGSIFGGSQGAPNGGVGSVPPWVMAGIQSTVPMYQQGVNDNIAAQQAALTGGVQDYAALANQLQGYAQQSAQGQNLGNLGAMGLGVLNALGTETTLPSMDLGALRSRVSNFRPASASRAAVDAAATPTYDATAIMQTLGSRSAPMIAQLESQRMGARNQAAQQRNLALDTTEQNRISQLNQIDQTEMAYNLGQQEKERALREGRRQLLTGTMAQGVQRSADINTGLLSQIGSIQSQTLPAMLQLQLQNAGLTGQNMMLGAQNALNAYGLYGSMASQNATANYLNQNNPIPPAAQPPEVNNTGNCPAGQIMSCGTCVSATTNDPHGCLSNQMWVDATQTCVCQ